MNKKVKNVLLWSIPPVVVIGLIYFINKQSIKKKMAANLNNSPLPEPAPETSGSTTSSSPSSTNLFPLKKGSKNDKVKDLQRLLGVSVDGIFGSQTEAALKSFSGKTTVDSQSELDALTAKKATQQNQTASVSRAQTLLSQFQNGGLNVFTQQTLIAYGYVADYSGAINYTNKNITMAKGKRYNNADYKLIGTTKAGNLQMQVTRGDAQGYYIVNPNIITLVK